MFTLFVILTILSAVLLICVVLIQKSKGGGLSSTFAGSNQVMGVRRTNNFIEKVTWYLAAAIAVFAILSSYTMGDAIQSAPRTSNNAVQQQTGTNYDAEAPETNAQETPAATEAPEQSAPAAQPAENAEAAPVAQEAAPAETPAN